MRVGDLLEWLAAAALSVATYLATARAWPALIVVGCCLAYFAQCHAATPFPRLRVRVKMPRLRGKRAKLEG